MKRVRVLTAEEAALLVNDGDTIATGGFVSCACPEALSTALEKRFLETGHPKDLTLFFAAGQGHRDGTGGDTANRLAAGRAAATAIVTEPELLRVSIVRVAGTKHLGNVSIIMGTLVKVSHYHGNGSAGRPALEHAGQNLDLVAFLAPGRKLALSGFPAV